MRISSLLVLSLLSFSPAPLWADEDPQPEDVANDYLFGDAAERALAEKVVASAPAETLRKIVAALRRISGGGLVFGPAPAPVPGSGPPSGAACGGPDVPGPTIGVEPPTWEPLPPGEASADAPLIHVKARFLHTTKKAAARLGLLDAAGNPTRGTLGTKEIQQLLAAFEKDPDVVQVTAPSLTAQDRQKASLSLTSKISYVQDYDVRLQKDGTGIADPILGSVEEGIVLEVRPAVAADGQAIVLDVTFSVAELVRPIPQWKARLGADGGHEVVIQLPEVRIVRRSRRVVVAPGDTVILDGWPQVVSASRDGGKPVDEIRLGLAILEAHMIPATAAKPASPKPR